MGGSIGAMTALNTTPIPDLETALARVDTLTKAATEAVEHALHAEPGSRLRADHACDALANLEELESVIRDTRTGVEALP